MPKDEDFGRVSDRGLTTEGAADLGGAPERAWTPRRLERRLPGDAREAFLLRLGQRDRDHYRKILEGMGLVVRAFSSPSEAWTALENRTPALVMMPEPEVERVVGGMRRVKRPAGLLPEVIALRSVEAHLREPLAETTQALETLSVFRKESPDSIFLERRQKTGSPSSPLVTAVLHPAEGEELAPIVERLMVSRAYRVDHLHRQRFRTLYDRCLHLSLLESERPLAQEGLELTLHVAGAVAGAVVQHRAAGINLECVAGGDGSRMTRALEHLESALEMESEQWEWVPLSSSQIRGKRRALGERVVVVPLIRKPTGHYKLVIFPGAAHRWDPDTIEDVQLVVAHMRLAWEALDRRSTWPPSETRDPWTGLFGEEALLRTTQPHDRKSRRMHTGIVVLDIDGFTTLNETMGHLAGGALLRVLARRIQGVVEKDMLLARVGADEFAVLVHRANPRRLDRLAVSLKESVSKQPFELGEPFGTVDISVTVGYASGDELAGRKTKKRILERARDAVRQGRKRGGDCMVKAE